MHACMLDCRLHEDPAKGVLANLSAFVPHLQAKKKLIESCEDFSVANPSLVGERVPDMPLFNTSNGQTEGLHSILQVRMPMHTHKTHTQYIVTKNIGLILKFNFFSNIFYAK